MSFPAEAGEDTTTVPPEPGANPIAPVTVPPTATSSVPPFSTTPVAVPPARTSNTPPGFTTTPDTSPVVSTLSVPPLLTTTLSMLPPKSGPALPPLFTMTLLATLPFCTPKNPLALTTVLMAAALTSRNPVPPLNVVLTIVPPACTCSSEPRSITRPLLVAPETYVTDMRSPVGGQGRRVLAAAAACYAASDRRPDRARLAPDIAASSRRLRVILVMLAS